VELVLSQISRAANEREFAVIAYCFMPDHLHLFVETDPRWAPAEIVGKFKAVSSRLLRQEFPFLRSRLPTLWSRSYFIATVGAVSDATIRRLVEEGRIKIEPWDYRYYAEKVRKARYAFDEAQLKPYYEFDHVLIDGVFFAATKLYGITFKERKDLPVYLPEIRIFEVTDHDGKPLALFIVDWYARPSKRGGAWMNQYVGQSGLMGTKPVVANHLNIPKPPAGEPTLLTYDEVRTAFHEFGHALHGMFSNVKFPRFSGTSVPRDFVEYPSQVNEMWMTWPEILKNYAKHHKTGEPMPAELLEKVLAADGVPAGAHLPQPTQPSRRLTGAASAPGSSASRRCRASGK
jgi:Zn-dependent oligopeptidase